MLNLCSLSKGTQSLFETDKNAFRIYIAGARYGLDERVSACGFGHSSSPRLNKCVWRLGVTSHISEDYDSRYKQKSCQTLDEGSVAYYFKYLILTARPVTL